MITIPTTELIGGLNDVLPIITDPKSELAGVKVAWDGESLHFTAYDVLSGGTVAWTPGEGAEADIDDEAIGSDLDENWGGDDEPWATWIYLDSAKEILKLFKLPAKLWRTPVTIKCSLNRDRLIIERTDSPRGERLLTLPADPEQLRHIPDVREIGNGAHRKLVEHDGMDFFAHRIGSFGTVRPHGTMALSFSSPDEPVGIRIGTRYTGFIYRADATGVRPFNLLREGVAS